MNNANIISLEKEIAFKNNDRKGIFTAYLKGVATPQETASALDIPVEKIYGWKNRFKKSGKTVDEYYKNFAATFERDEVAKKFARITSTETLVFDYVKNYHNLNECPEILLLCYLFIAKGKIEGFEFLKDEEREAELVSELKKSSVIISLCKSNIYDHFITSYPALKLNIVRDIYKNCSDESCLEALRDLTIDYISQTTNIKFVLKAVFDNEYVASKTYIRRLALSFHGAVKIYVNWLYSEFVKMYPNMSRTTFDNILKIAKSVEYNIDFKTATMDDLMEICEKKNLKISAKSIEKIEVALGNLHLPGSGTKVIINDEHKQWLAENIITAKSNGEVITSERIINALDLLNYGLNLSQIAKATNVSYGILYTAKKRLFEAFAA